MGWLIVELIKLKWLIRKLAGTAGGTITGGANDGTGAGTVFRNVITGLLHFKTLKAGTNVQITNNAADITISATDTGEANTGSNVGPGIGVFRKKSGVNLEFKSLSPGSSKISIVNDTPGNDIVIDTTAEANTASNVGTGSGVFKQKSGVDLQFKSIKPGTNVQIATNTDDLTISTTAEANTASNVGPGIGVFRQKSGVNLEFKSLSPGSNKVSVVNDTPGNDITIDVDPSKFTGIPESGVTNLVTDLAAKVSTASNVGPGIGVFRKKTGTNFEFKSLSPGSSKISIVNDTPGNDITIDTTAEANTASNTGSGVGVFRQKVGVDLQFKSFSPGSDKVTITADTPNDRIDVDVDERRMSPFFYRSMMFG